MPSSTRAWVGFFIGVDPISFLRSLFMAVQTWQGAPPLLSRLTTDARLRWSAADVDNYDVFLRFLTSSAHTMWLAFSDNMYAI